MVAEQQDQLRKLQLELAELKMENEMLKKAAAYFAKNLKCGMNSFGLIPGIL